jgi:acetoin utilization deacetylase AcuC-like enzyme
MAAPVLFRHPASAGHDTGAHPERADRIVAVEERLAAAGWLGYTVLESPVAARGTLLAVHTDAHVERLERLDALGGGAIDGDTLMSQGSLEAALRGCGGAVALVDALLAGGEVRRGASVHRPPGHHATADRAMGFCLLNNVAVAARHALDAHGVGRVLILDFDVHHGNGTNDIFHAAGEVLFVSIHESPLYPGSGPASDQGSGDGLGFTVNVPVPGGSGDELWCALVEHVVVPVTRSYDPALILISAGFDAHAADPLATCTVSEDGFAAMTGSMCRVADELSVPLGVVLEGGYDLGALARSLERVLAVVAGGTAPPEAPADGAEHPFVRAAWERLAPRWGS